MNGFNPNRRKMTNEEIEQHRKDLKRCILESQNILKKLEKARAKKRKARELKREKLKQLGDLGGLQRLDELEAEEKNLGRCEHITDELGEMLMDIASNYCRRPNLSGYSFQDILVSDMVLKMMLNIKNIDVDNQPFAYLTRACACSSIDTIKRQMKYFNMIEGKYSDIIEVIGDTGEVSFTLPEEVEVVTDDGIYGPDFELVVDATLSPEEFKFIRENGYNKTIAQFAHMLRVSPQLVTAWESGDIDIPMEVVLRLS